MNLEGSPVVDQFESRINYSWSSGTGYKGMPADHFQLGGQELFVRIRMQSMSLLLAEMMVIICLLMEKSN